jgi:ribonuclease HI
VPPKSELSIEGSVLGHKEMRRIKLYMDGSSIVRVKSGGWSFVAVENHRVIHRSSGWFRGTNNEGELRAMINALAWASAITRTADTNEIGEPQRGDKEFVMELFSDSSYVLGHLYKFVCQKTDSLKLVGVLDHSADHSGKIKQQLSGILARSPPNYYQDLWQQLTDLLEQLASGHTLYFWWLRGHQKGEVGSHSQYHQLVDRASRSCARAGSEQEAKQEPQL